MPEMFCITYPGGKGYTTSLGALERVDKRIENKDGTWSCCKSDKTDDTISNDGLDGGAEHLLGGFVITGGCMYTLGVTATKLTA